MDKTSLYAKAFLENTRDVSESEFLLTLSRLISLLKKKEETDLYPRILQKVISSLEYEKIATVVTARPLGKEMEKEVIKNLKRSFPEVSEENVNFRIDEKITGGIFISYRDFLFDGTIRGVFQKLLATK